MFETVFGLVVLLGCIFILWLSFQGENGKRQWKAFVSDPTGKYIVFILILSLLVLLFMIANNPSAVGFLKKEKETRV